MADGSHQRRRALAKIGRAVLRLRLYLRWSQLDLERSSGVDQTTISRLERGVHAGLSLKRLAPILDALRVGEVVFDRQPTAPQTDLEIMLYGDPWKRAVAEADRRLQWPRAADEPGADEPGADEPGADELQGDETDDSVFVDQEAWIGNPG